MKSSLKIEQLLELSQQNIFSFFYTGGSNGKESACNAGDLVSFPGLGRSPEGGHGTLVFLPGESPWTESIGSPRVGYN